MTTVASLPSALRKAVASRLLRLLAALTRCAPGRIYFEKWPM